MHNKKRAKAGDRIALEHKKEAARSKMSAKCTIKNGRKNAPEVHNKKKTSSPEGKDVFLSYKRLAISGVTAGG